MAEPLIPDMQVWGTEREESLAAIQEQLRTWGLTMPQAEPIMLHFGLGDFRRIGETEFWIVNEDRAGYCGKFLFVFGGQTCPYHKHDVKHETFFIVKGTAKMVIDDEARIMNEGDTYVMPPGTRHSFTGVGNALLLEVSMPSTLRDNFFADKRIGEGGVI